MGSNVIRRLYETWSQDDLSNLDSLIAEKHTIFSDPGDAWEGQTRIGIPTASGSFILERRFTIWCSKSCS